MAGVETGETLAGLRNRAITAWRGPGLWAMADQGVVSVGNFVVTIAVARDVPPADLGAFGVLLGVLLTANVAHGSLIGVPLMVLSGQDRARRDRLPTVALAVTTLSLVPYGVALTAAVLLLRRPGLLVPVLVALAGSQVQETLRRSLIGRMEFRRASLGDAVSYLGQAVAVVVLAASGRLTLSRVFLAVGATSLVAAVVQWRQVRPRLSGEALAGETLAPFWRLGRAMVVVNGVGALTIYTFPWLLGALRGVTTVGSLQALLTVVSVANPLMIAVNSLVTTKVAHTEEGDRDRRHSTELGFARRYGTLVGVPFLAYAAFLVLAPGSALRLFFGPDSAYGGLGDELRVLVGFSIALFTYFVLAGVLAGRQDTRSLLQAQLAAVAAVAVVGVPLIVVAGLGGALVAAVVSSVVRAAVAARAVGRAGPGGAE
jgi:O-antigen/teichoic acid export membrane protein